MVVWEQLVDRNFCLQSGAAVETLSYQWACRRVGLWVWTPVLLSFWQFLVPIRVQLSISALCATFYQSLTLKKEFLEFYCLRESHVAQIGLWFLIRLRLPLNSLFSYPLTSQMLRLQMWVSTSGRILFSLEWGGNVLQASLKVMTVLPHEVMSEIGGVQLYALRWLQSVLSLHQCLAWLG